ncbi:AtzE family amidohydrolase [Acetobacter suratthaniensis]|uniref:AtzE family amidohydrolase n=1 Tax=Acetobacter suratthaniensis TaxID=1502841 RepID=A0ABS3LJD9_9PROT|nr:AtzE family amidohydrolase [Acetobacter suratthaniensis]MBO1327709.1 AtzE family amidohydrolase [Acetobacter suratthaniensis]MCX2565691.1 AtzE family amidohydrolase [Acetobacter suratthaniensis]
MTAGVQALAERVRSRTVRVSDSIRATLDTITRHDKGLNAVTRVLSTRALQSAAAQDAFLEAGGTPGPLAGVPFGVKDLFDLEGITTTAGSAALANTPPATQDALAITRLIRAGAIPVATLNMDEFAYGFVTENAHYGRTANPHDTARLAGGSSGGSAASVAAGLLPFSLGSDTNGSIRVPASLCGVWGLRPTYGRLPLDGVYPFAASLDTIGPFARSAADLHLVFAALATDTPQTAPPTESHTGTLRVARLGGWFAKNLDPDLEQGITRLMEHCGTRQVINLPEVERARAAAFLITAAEGGNLHLPRLRNNAQAYDPATRDRLLAGALLPAGPVIQAHRFRSWFREAIHGIFRDYDILIAPATPGPAPLHANPILTLDGRPVPARANLGLFTQPISLAGVPVLSAPLPCQSRHTNTPTPDMPLGIQLIAAPGQEERLLSLGIKLEKAGLLGRPAAQWP